MTEAVPLTGGCQCGACRYSVAAPAGPVYACHCIECRKQSASAFGMSMPVALASLTVEGHLGCFTRETDSGSRTDCFFCSTCGTRLYHQSHRSPATVTIKAGTLDCADRLAPVAHLWVSRKPEWLQLSIEVPSFATQPADLEAWRAALEPGATNKGNGRG